MIGLLDVGGGLRGIYSAGIYDYLEDHNIKFDYYLGISAGSANLVSFTAGQRGRNYDFYMNYAFRKDYMSLHNLVRKGEYLDLDYVYSTLCNTGGEDPVDYESFQADKSPYFVQVTNAITGEAKYFSKSDIPLDNYDIIKASCCVPLACKSVYIDGVPYFDGGISDPVPFKKAFKDGCDHLIVVLTKPEDEVVKRQKFIPVFERKLKDYPVIAEEVSSRNGKYNDEVRELREYEKDGRVLVVSPKDTFGMKTLNKDKEALHKLYDLGFEDAKKIEKYVNEIRCSS